MRKAHKKCIHNVKHTRYWLPIYDSDDVVYEAMWALNILFHVEGCATSFILPIWSDKTLLLAQQVCKNPYLERVEFSDNDWKERYPDVVGALREAAELVKKLKPSWPEMTSTWAYRARG